MSFTSIVDSLPENEFWRYLLSEQVKRQTSSNLFLFNAGNNQIENIENKDMEINSNPSFANRVL